MAALDGASWTSSTRVLARDGRLLGERASRVGLRGHYTPLDDVSPRLVLATIASEDRAFYAHDGVDRTALVHAAAWDALHFKLVRGGSTITAQLVKRLDHQGKAHPRTFRTKLVEMARAQNLEAEADKRTILEAYLNHLDYGRGFAGPEAAAQGYFNVPAKELSLAQAAFLAVLPRAPAALDPYRHLARATSRQRALLRTMGSHGDVSAEDLARALEEPIIVRPRGPTPLYAPHVVIAAAKRAADGSEAPGAITTTLDLDLQRDAEAALRTHTPRLREHGASSVAAIVVDNATGEILAEVGSADYFDKRAGAVDLVRRRRQAGSTLKPFVYARAFERGTSPMQMLADVATELGTTGAIYAPDNFDGTFVGPISAREALAGSLNVPAVRIAAELGARELVATLRRAGLRLNGGAERFGLSIALGSGEVSPRELAEAYAMLGRGGDRVPLRDRLAGEASERTVGERVFDAGAVALVADALSDPLARVRGLRARGPFELPFPVALKTGTSTGYRDAWTAGFTRERTVVVWVGNADGAPTNHLTGATGAGPVFFDLMKRAMRDVGSRGLLSEPALTEVAEVCALSGERPSVACPDRVQRVFARGKAPDHTCTVHRHARARIAIQGDPPVACAGQGDRTIVALPDTFARFLSERPLGAPGLDPHGLPWYLASRAPDCDGGGGARPRVVLVSPREGAVVRAAGTSADVLEIVATTEGLPLTTPLDVLVDGHVLVALAQPYKGIVPIGFGDHAIEVRPRDPSLAAHVGRAAISVR
jgi:penicillin-binding protein 1C